MKEKKMELTTDLSNIKELNQVGIIVKDVDSTVEYLKSTFGIKLNVMTPAPSKGVLRGKEIEFQLKVALGRAGNVDLELIQVLSGEHLFKEFLDKHGEGIHHFGIYVKNLDEAIKQWEEKGGKLLQRNEHKVGIKTAYLDVEEKLGNLYLELIQL